MRSALSHSFRPPGQLAAVFAVVTPSPAGFHRGNCLRLRAANRRITARIISTRQRAEYLRQPVFATLYEESGRVRAAARANGCAHCFSCWRHRSSSVNVCSRDSRRRGGPRRIAEAVGRQPGIASHGFILVHDDIIDRAETRRGLPTLHRADRRPPFHVQRPWTRGAQPCAGLGDILFALAQKCLLEAALPPGASARLGIAACSLAWWKLASAKRGHHPRHAGRVQGQPIRD